MSEDDVRMEFASPEWLAMLRKMLVARAATHPPVLRGATCEVYLDVPAHLNPDASGRLAWTRRMRGGQVVVTFDECADEDASIKLVGEYAALLPLARFIISDENEAEFGKLIGAEIAAGRIQLVREERAPGARDHTVHNIMAALTR